MQMIERPWGVTAYGASSVKAMPDLVRARFKVIRVEPTPSEAFAAASEAVQAVRQTLRQHGISDAAVERSRLGLKSSWSYGGSERKFVGYECQASFAVESGALDDVQPLLVDLVAAGANEIDAVDFDVSGKGELRAEARRQAVGAARRKAELFAEAAGVRLGAVLHIDDVDPEQIGSGRYHGHGSGGEASPEDLAPGHVVVSAAVILGFSINHD
ncbi:MULTISPECIES: SIMPL domain-containing protein [unclassified Actinomadura]|uniref:SIMPL domain-containing protein n=1 Tax=unclassified Actinomadura TaxID=2626254 RepID=UPI0011EBD045|nr:SIMPL domain-containing protein [Actinomadura sp. K4S16]